MKKKLLTFSMSIFVFLFIGIIITLIFSFLDYKDIINPLTSNIIIGAISSLLYFIFALYTGFKSKKRGLLIGIALFLTYFFISFIIKGLSTFTALSNLMNFIIRSLLLISGSVIGVNIANKR